MRVRVRSGRTAAGGSCKAKRTATAKYRDLSTSAAKCSAFGRDDGSFFDGVYEGIFLK